MQTHVRNIENECDMGDTRNDRSELRVEWRKLQYHMLHNLCGTLLLLVLLLGLLVTEYACMCVHGHTHTIVHFSATAFKSVSILSLPSKCTCISPSNDFCASIKDRAVWYNSQYKKHGNNYCFPSVI